jgi:PiT family inorganic phosphate transporter
MVTIFAAEPTLGIPVSTTLCIEFWALRARWWQTRAGCSWGTLRNIAAAWVFTLPAAALLSGTLFYLFSQIAR